MLTSNSGCILLLISYFDICNWLFSISLKIWSILLCSFINLACGNATPAYLKWEKKICFIYAHLVLAFIRLHRILKIDEKSNVMQLHGASAPKLKFIIPTDVSIFYLFWSSWSITYSCRCAALLIVYLAEVTLVVSCWN